MKRISGLYAVLTPSSIPHSDPLDATRASLTGGAKILQLRDKSGDKAKETRLAHELAKLKSEFDFIYIINDDPQLAIACGADGVHVGQGDMPVDQVRKLIGKDKIIGLSTHTLEEFKNGLKTSADYLALGAIFPTQAKGPEHPIVGLDLLREVVLLSDRPVVAIGGINRKNADQVMATGVPSVAMISSLFGGNIIGETKYFSSLFHD